ncbi:hypothetical protein [Acinetobacter sp. TW_SC_4]
MTKKLLKYIALLAIGFIGGCLSPMFLSLFSPNVASLDQAYSIANTYIVFTTIFFVGITVLLALGSYVISQQLATTREQLETQAHKDLMKRIKYSESIATDIVKSLAENGDFKNQITQNIKEHTHRILADAAQESNNKVIEEQSKTVKLKGMLDGLGKREES